MAKKIAAKYQFRQVLLDSGESNLQSVWIESCQKRRGEDLYDLVLRTSGDLNTGDVETVESLLKGDAGPLSSGYEHGYECCGGGSSYIEFDVGPVPFPD